MPQRPAPTSGSGRRLGHQQMAFVRAWAEGVNPAQAWARYLGEGAAPDARRVRGELQRLLDLLRSVARAQGRPDLAALLRRDPEAMADPPDDRPSLDEFRALQPEDFYSEAELLALYQATHGAPDARSGARRRQRLRARQVAALQWLESVAVRDPQPEDAVAGWLDERLAARLAAAGLRRLADLGRHIATRGYHWHRPIARVGPAAAARVRQWWQQHAASLGPLPPWALVPPAGLDRAALLARPPATPAVPAAARPGALPGQPGTMAAAPRIAASGGLPPWPVPLERLQVPAALQGRDGRHRAPATALRMAAAHDLHALQAWLRLRAAGSATWRAYRKEAERVLLWALWVVGKPLSSLDEADAQAYPAFLAAPPAGWTAPRGTPRWHDDWRPFEAALSPRSAAMALGIVRNLFAWWVAQGYLKVNVWTPGAAAPSSTADPDARDTPGLGRPDIDGDSPVADALSGASPGAAAGAAEPCADGTGRQGGRLTGAARRPGVPQGPAAAARGSPVSRALTATQCRQVQDWIGQAIAHRGHTPGLLRLQALWAVASTSGLRPAELVAAQLGWLQHGVEGLALQVPARRGTPRRTADSGGPGAPLHEAAPRRLVLDAAAAAAVQRYLAARGVASAVAPQAPGVQAGAPAVAGITWPGDAPRPEAPLFSQLRSPQPLSPARLYEVLSQALRACADALQAQDPANAADAMQLRQASTLWLRHGVGLQAALQGVPAGALRQRMGHRSRASTAAYRRAALALSSTG